MANKLIRRKPGFTRNGEVRIVSLNIKQLLQARQKATKKKIIAKFDRRLTLLGYVAPATSPEETQPV